MSLSLNLLWSVGCMLAGIWGFEFGQGDWLAGKFFILVRSNQPIGSKSLLQKVADEMNNWVTSIDSYTSLQQSYPYTEHRLIQPNTTCLPSG